MTDFFTGTVPPSGDTTNIRDAAYRSFRMNTPVEATLTHNTANTVNGDFAGATGYYPVGLGSQNLNDSIGLYVLGRYYHTVQVYHTQANAISVQIEGTLDGLTWVSIGSAITSDGITTFTGIYKFIRVHVSTLTLTGGPDYTTDYGVRVVYIGLAQQ